MDGSRRVVSEAVAVESCGTCGARTAAAARFCSACGAGLDVADVELDVFSGAPQPTTAVEPAPAGSPRRVPLLLGLLGALGVAVALSFVSGGDVESPPDPAVPLAESPPEIGDSPAGTEVGTAAAIELVAAPGLDWTAGPEISGVWPLAFVECDGSSLFFATGPLDPLGVRGEGLSVWRSDNATRWSSLGPVIAAPNTVNAVIAGPVGLIAVGVDGDQAPVVWTSLDAINWEVRPLPLDLVPDGAMVEPTALASSGDLTVIVGILDRVDLHDFVRAAVVDVVDLDLTHDNVETDFSGSTLLVRLRGPFGLPLAEFTAADLGLSESELTELETAPIQPVTVVWSSADGGDWQTAELDQFYANSLAAVNEGGIVVTGFGSGFARGDGVLVSIDGLEWTVNGNASVGSIVRWGANIVGVANGAGTGLRVSANGADWATVRVGRILPAGPDWFMTRVAAGDRGVVALADGIVDTDRVERSPVPAAAIVVEGFTLLGGDDQIIVREDGLERLRVPAYDPIDGSYRVDLTEGTVTFVDPVTSEAIVTVTVEELRELQWLGSASVEPQPSQLILTSIDGQTWSLSDASELADGPRLVGALGVMDDAVVVAVARFSSQARWPPRTPTVQLFAADLAP